jgi:uncharacterized protein (TIGR03083 family)
VGIDERAAYRDAASWFRSVVDGVDGRWDAPGLGEWTVRDLVGHTSRSLVTVEAYLDAATVPVAVETAVDYYAVVSAAAAGPGVAQRGRDAGAALGADPVGFLAELDARVQARVAAEADDAPVATIAGGMRLVDYLPTRTFELVVHTADLRAALGTVDGPPAPGTAVASVFALVGQLAAARGAVDDVLLALTGRRPLPGGFTLL